MKGIILKYSIRLIAFVLLSCTAGVSAVAQKASVKTNLLSDALLNPNAAVEFAVAPKWTIDISGQVNFWKLSDNKQWRHWVVQPEARYWFCDRFYGHFVGVHLLGGQYNVGGIDFNLNFLGTDFRKLKETRYQGWFGGAGVVYGYDWVLSDHWNLEAVIGVGWTYTRFDRYRCTGCGKKIEENKPHNYFGPTKIAVNLEYVF